MSATIKTWVKSLLPAKLRKKIYKLGVFLYIEETFPSVEGSLNMLKRWGFQPKTAIDIGAYVGNWTSLFKEFFPDCRILMIEAQEDKLPSLRETASQYADVSIENVLLGPEDGVEVDFVEMATGSSVFEESSPYKRSHVRKKQTSLDSLIEKNQAFGRPDFLKLDVQGYELEVLKGAKNLLSGTEIVLLEASFIPVNQGCPLIDEVVSFMAASNFRLLDVCSQHRRKDSSLWQTDLLFIRNDSTFVPLAKLDESNWRKIK